MEQPLITIRDIYGTIIYKCYAKSFKDAVEQAIKNDVSLININFICTDLRGINFSRLNLIGTYFINVNLSGANFSNAKLKYANFIRANLKDVNLKDANISYAILESVDLSNTTINNTNLRGTILNRTKTNKKYIQLSCIDTKKGMVTYCFDDDILWFDYFVGTLKEFEIEYIQTHTADSQLLMNMLRL